MRKIKWDEALTKDDITWLRAAGFMSEEQIARHQDQFGGKVPELEFTDDGVTRSALDPEARVADPAEGRGDGAPVLVDPTKPEGEKNTPEEPVLDDYESWKMNELEAEWKARDDLKDTTDVQVYGTGKGGAVTKADIVKGLRLWDDENPDALKD